MEARKSPICPPINLAGIDSASQFFVPVVRYNEQFYFSFLRKQKCPMKQINDKCYTKHKIFVVRPDAEIKHIIPKGADKRPRNI